MIHSIFGKMRTPGAHPRCRLAGVGDGVMTTDVHASRVLLVEDEFLLNMMLAEALEQHGFEVHSVYNAKDALEHLTCGAPCDILLTDINLAGGIDGTVLAKLARKLRPNLPVVYASGSVGQLERLAAMPGTVFVAKPYNPDNLCRMLKRITATS